jgi:predicted ATP-grasp superfamily ATP-dependent carboligase
MAIGATGLSYIRSLHKRGVPTLLLDERGWIGTPSRYELTLELPPITEEPDLWLETLVDAAQSSGSRPILLVAFDQAVLMVGKHAEELKRHYDFLIPPFEGSAAIVDKRRQYQLATAAGVPIPPTAYPESGGEATALAAEISYPCLLKPHVSYGAGDHFGGRKNAVIADARTLEAEFDRAAAAGIPCLVQEIVPGGDEALYGYLGFWGRDRNELAWITKQKLRQNPRLYGDGTCQRTIDVPRVAELSRRFLKALDYVGVGSVEFKYDARDDSYRLMEVNPRAVSGNQLAVAAGVDLPYISYAYLADGVVPSWEQRWDVRWVHELYDLKTLLRERRHPGAAVWEWVRSLHNADTFALGAWNDPAPLLGAFASTAFGKVARSVGIRYPRGYRAPRPPAPVDVPAPHAAD